jgi:hypothetical protein
VCSGYVCNIVFKSVSEQTNHRSRRGLGFDEGGNGVNLDVQSLPKWSPGITDPQCVLCVFKHGREIG